MRRINSEHLKHHSSSSSSSCLSTLLRPSKKLRSYPTLPQAIRPPFSPKLHSPPNTHPLKRDTPLHLFRYESSQPGRKVDGSPQPIDLVQLEVKKIAGKQTNEGLLEANRADSHFRPSKKREVSGPRTN